MQERERERERENEREKRWRSPSPQCYQCFTYLLTIAYFYSLGKIQGKARKKKKKKKGIRGNQKTPLKKERKIASIIEQKESLSVNYISAV